MTDKEEIKISLEDFPDDIYILLEDDFRAEFFKTAWKINRSYRHLAKKIGVSNPVMLSWRRGKINHNNLDQYCSVWDIKEIINHSKHSPGWKYDLEEVQKHVKSVRAVHGRKISNIKLPIEDSAELREIVTHLLCEGYASNKKHMTSKYGLTSIGGVKEFQNELSIFGEMPELKIREEHRHMPRAVMYILQFPKVITKILTKKFNIDFSWDKGRLPVEFFNGERKLLAAIVRAFFIDEGSIHDLSIKFSSNNLELLNDLKEICLKLGYKTLPIQDGVSCYQLSLSNKSFLDFYNDMISISPLPIVKKQKRLELGLLLLNKKYIHFDVESEIIKNLEKGPLTGPQLCELIVARRNNIINHLMKLKQKNIVQISKRRANGQGGGFIWELCR